MAIDIDYIIVLEGVEIHSISGSCEETMFGDNICELVEYYKQGKIVG
jgi:hypothetical protein